MTALYEITPVGGPTLNAPLRYQTEPVRPEPGRGEEYGFVRVRYKLPGEEESREISRPIRPRDYSGLDAAPQSARFAIAVAGFAQLLRGDDYLSQGFGYEDALRLAQQARGRSDPSGREAEFIAMIEAAQAAQTRP